MIPRFKPCLGREELKVLFRTNKGAVGRFEKKFASAFGACDAIAFPYGRSALWTFLKAMGVNDAEVILPAYTCSVVAHAITLSGNRPRTVDINLTDYNIDLDLLPEAINENTRAIVATHLFGYPMDILRLKAIIADAEARYGRKIWVIEDCAHSFGATRDGYTVGTSGDVGLYALNISKMITAIFGGILTFGDQILADQVRLWRDQHFRKPSLIKSVTRRLYLLAVYIAFNKYIYGITWGLQEKTPFLDRLTKFYHLDKQIHFPPDYLDQMLDVEASVGLEQIRKYQRIVDRRRENALWFDQNLDRRNGWVFPPIIEGSTYSHYVVRVPNRIECVTKMAKCGIHVGELIQYSIPRLPEYNISTDCTSALLASQSTINIPVGDFLTADDRWRIAKSVRDIQL